MVPLLSIFSVVPSKVVDQLETSRWILFIVCAVGVALAYVTDEGYSLLIDDEGVAIPNSIVSAVKTTKVVGGSNEFSCTAVSVAAFVGIIADWVSSSAGAFRASLPETIASSLDRLMVILRRKLVQFELYKEGFRIKRQAKTRRQFFYMLAKRTMNLPIKPEETEVDSYLDVKGNLYAEWPFSWEVSNVKSDKIKCSGYDCIPMSSYSYLDLLRDNRVQSAAIKAAHEWSSGNHGPRMLGGNTKILRELENVITGFFKREDTLLCATGFLACMSACSAVSSAVTVCFIDSRLHASLTTGLKIGEGKTVRFCHNNFEDCEKKIKKFRHKYLDSWMIVESVYSMDGDLCDLPKAYALCQKYNIKLMIDEAHGLGVIGKTGRGVEEHYNMQGCATLLVGTFSKSVASIGGYITGPKRLVSYLEFHAPGNVFSAPLPAYCAGAAIKSFQLMDEEPHIITRAQEMSKLLRSKLVSGGGYWPENYPEHLKYVVEGHPSATVLPIIFPDDVDRVMRTATALKKRGFMCSAVAYPACPFRRPRFRITGTAALTPEVIESFIKTLVEICVEQPASEFKQMLIM